MSLRALAHLAMNNSGSNKRSFPGGTFMAYQVRVIPKKKRRTMQPGVYRKARYELRGIERHLTCLLEKERIFWDLPRPVLTALDAISSSARYPKGAILFAEGQAACGVFIL